MTYNELVILLSTKSNRLWKEINDIPPRMGLMRVCEEVQIDVVYAGSDDLERACDSVWRLIQEKEWVETPDSPCKGYKPGTVSLDYAMDNHRRAHAALVEQETALKPCLLTALAWQMSQVANQKLEQELEDALRGEHYASW